MSSFKNFFKNYKGSRFERFSWDLDDILKNTHLNESILYKLPLEEILKKMMEKNELNDKSLPKLKKQLSLAKKENNKIKYDKIKKIMEIIENPEYHKKEEKISYNNFSLEQLKEKFNNYNITENEIKILRKYKITGDINEELRKFNIKIQKKIDILDKIFNENRLKHDIILYRSLTFYSSDSSRVIKILKELESGEFTDIAYLSSTSDRNVIYSFRDEMGIPKQNGYQFLFKIHCKKGQKVLFIDFFHTYHQNEKEFLINRNSKIKILSIKEDFSGFAGVKEFVVDAELL